MSQRKLLSKSLVMAFPLIIFASSPMAEVTKASSPSSPYRHDWIFQCHVLRNCREEQPSLRYPDHYVSLRKVLVLL